MISSALLQQPIVACATPRGEGAVSIVRISGAGVFDVADQCFSPAGSVPLSAAGERTMVYGTFTDGETIVDRCLAVRFVGPATFSGEDMVEFHLHGNPLIVDLVIRRCVDLGCRPAEAGEFSRRAFLNGKMDLAQAEGLAEVIRAESEAALDMAQRQLGGELSVKMAAFRERIVRFLGLLELELDFVQEGYELLDFDDLEATVTELSDVVSGLLDIYKGGDRLRRGPRILLLGRPNAGKSSLFNAFLGHSRALVSDTPGTTRDYLEERILHSGVILHLLDTAGLRSTEDSLEAEGVTRAKEMIPLADRILYLIDGTLPQEEIIGEFERLELLRGEYRGSGAAIFQPVLTKRDMVEEREDIGGYGLPGYRDDEIATCSVRDRVSITALLDGIVHEYTAAVANRLSLLTERQYHLLRQVRRKLGEISIDRETPTEFLSADLRELLNPLSELTGEVTNEDILDVVFSGFCIGK